MPAPARRRRETSTKRCIRGAPEPPQTGLSRLLGAQTARAACTISAPTRERLGRHAPKRDPSRPRCRSKLHRASEMLPRATLSVAVVQCCSPRTTGGTGAWPHPERREGRARRGCWGHASERGRQELHAALSSLCSAYRFAALSRRPDLPLPAPRARGSRWHLARWRLRTRMAGRLCVQAPPEAGAAVPTSRRNRAWMLSAERKREKRGRGVDSELALALQPKGRERVPALSQTSHPLFSSVIRGAGRAFSPQRHLSVPRLSRFSV